MTKPAHDVVVIGNTVGALLAAGILARRRKRVLVLETVRWEDTVNGLRLCHHPTLLWGHSGGRHLDRAFREMGRPMHKLPALQPADPPLQLLREGFRLDVPRKREDLAADLARRHGVAPDGIFAVYNRLAEVRQEALKGLSLAPGGTEKGLWHRAADRLRAIVENKPEETLASLAGQAGLPGPLVDDLLSIQQPFSALTDRDGRLLTALQVFGHGELDTFHLRGNGDGFTAALVQLLREMEIEFVDAEVTHVWSIGSRVKAIELSGGQPPIPGRAFIWGGSFLGLADLLKEDPTRQRVATFSLAPAHVALPVHFRIPREVLPVGMGKYLLCESAHGSRTSSSEGPEPASSPIPHDRSRTVLLTVSDQGPADSILITATAFLPAEKPEVFAAAAGAVRDRIRETLRTLLPFGGDQLECVGWAGSLRFAEAHRRSGHMVYQFAPGRRGAKLGLSLKSRWSNFFFATPEVCPFWGLDGEAFAARAAARACLRLLPG